jgi:hypothetical protein
MRNESAELRNEVTESTFPDLDEVMNFSGSSVDVEQFGATANDGTDDTAAIQAALDHLQQNGGTLNFEADGVYTLTGGLLLDGAEGFKIDGNGATIRVADDASLEEGAALRINDSSDFAVTDLAIDTGLTAGDDDGDVAVGSADDAAGTDDGQGADSSAGASSVVALEITGGEDFYLSDVSSVGFENIGGPAVNLSVLGTAATDDAVASEDDLGVAEGGDDATDSAETETQTQAGIAASEGADDDGADQGAAAGEAAEKAGAAEDVATDDAAGDDTAGDGSDAAADSAAATEAGEADPADGGEDDAALQSAGAALGGETDQDGLDFSAVIDEGTAPQPDPIEDQSILDGLNGVGDDTAAASFDAVESGSDDVSLLGVNADAQMQHLGDFATS